MSSTPIRVLTGSQRLVLHMLLAPQLLAEFCGLGCGALREV